MSRPANFVSPRRQVVQLRVTTGWYVGRHCAGDRGAYSSSQYARIGVLLWKWWYRR